MKKKIIQGKVEPPKPWPNPSVSLRSQLRAWLKEICPKQNIEDYCQIMADSTAPEVMKVRVFTHDYCYSITAKELKGELACLLGSASRRKSLAGATDHLYTDLITGDFTRVTWELIKAAILRFELVKITAKAKEEQWREMSSHYEIDGEQFYGEWFQRGDETRDHKAYKLFAMGEKGVLVKPEANQK